MAGDWGQQTSDLVSRKLDGKIQNGCLRETFVNLSKPVRLNLSVLESGSRNSRFPGNCPSVVNREKGLAQYGLWS